MTAEIVKLNDYREYLQYKCNCGGSHFRFEYSKRLGTETICTNCGRVQHQEDIFVR